MLNRFLICGYRTVDCVDAGPSFLGQLLLPCIFRFLDILNFIFGFYLIPG